MNCCFSLCASTQIGELSRSAAPRVGPKGPSAKLLAAIVEMKRRNPKAYSIDQVVHDCGDICQAVTELAAEMKALVTIAEFHTLNRCLDNAIADAVTPYASGPDDEISAQAESWQ